MKSLELTYSGVIDLDVALEQLGHAKAPKETAVIIAKNRKILREHLDALEVHRAMSPEMAEYDQKRQDMVAEFGSVRAEGNTVITQVDPARKQEFHEKLQPIREEYATAIVEHDAKLRKFREVILPGPANDGKPIELHLLPNALPAECTGNLVYALIDLIEFGKKKKE